MSDFRTLRAYAWSMSPLPEMPVSAPPLRVSRGGTCESCGGGTYKGATLCRKCRNRPIRSGTCTSCGHRTWKGADLCATCKRSAAAVCRAPCWICARPITCHGAPRPTCRDCRQKHGAGVCSECGGPKRLIKPGLCRACRPVKPKAEPGICKLCEEPYVPKKGARPDQVFCSKSCAQAWRNGARPPYSKRIVVGMERKTELRRIRSQRRAETWDGVTNAEILERDRWRCGICGQRIGKTFKYPHPRSASVDHVIPLTEGGGDTAANKRAAHLGCNQRRMNRGGGEQLAMIG